MRADELLLWLSARREGSWQQFRAAVEELHSSEYDSQSDLVPPIDSEDFPLHQMHRLNLECQGHVEFFARDCEAGWRVTAPILAAHSLSSGTRAVLCGARSPSLIQRAQIASEGVRSETIELEDAPSVIRLSAGQVSDLKEIAAQIGVGVQLHAPLAILSFLPPCNPPSKLQPDSEFPQGSDWIIYAFDTANLAWRKIHRHEANDCQFGVFRFLIHFQRPRHFLRWRGKTFEIPRAVAIYVLLRRRRLRVLEYGSESLYFSLPAICRPPKLLERALVLCSGLPPSYHAATNRLVYSDVPIDVARLAAELLCQPL